MDDVLILAGCSVIAFFGVFALFFKRESAEESAIVALSSVLGVAQTFPHLCRWEIICLYQESPLGLYPGAYAAVGAASAGLIAHFETNRRLKPHLGKELLNAVTTLASLGTSVIIGLTMWQYDTVIGLPVRPYIIFIPLFWMFGRMAYEDWP